MSWPQNSGMEQSRDTRFCRTLILSQLPCETYMLIVHLLLLSC